MKTRLFITTISLVLVFFNLPAQKLQIGLRNGLNVSSFSEITELNEGSYLRSGFGGGICLRYPLKNHFAIQTGLNFEQKGFRNFKEFSFADKKLNGTLEYLNVPINLERSFQVNESLRFFVATGPYVGVKLRSTLTYSAVSLAENSETITWKINDHDTGWSLGFGFIVPAGSYNIETSVKYSLGFSEITSAKTDYRNKAALFSLALYLL